MSSDTASQIAYLARVLKAPSLRDSAERLAAAARDGRLDAPGIPRRLPRAAVEGPVAHAGSPNSRQVTQAKAAVHMGVALSQWLAAGVPHPKL